MFGRLMLATVLSCGLTASTQALAGHYGAPQHAATYQACKKPHSRECHQARAKYYGAHWGRHEHRGINLDYGASERH
jgi:hypothetical protein